jgi:hypothetical protein
LPDHGKNAFHAAACRAAPGHFFVGDRPHIIEAGAYDIYATCEEQTDANGLASFRIAIGNDTNSVVEVGLSKIAVATGLNEPIPILSREAALEIIAEKADNLVNSARNLHDIEINKAKVNPTLRELVNAPGAQTNPAFAGLAQVSCKSG